MNDTEQMPRRPGRPKQDNPPVKKGRVSWKPASVTDVVDKDPSRRYRLLNKDPDNLAKKKAEGWEIENGVSQSGAKMLVDDEAGKNLTSTYERRDVILASMPEEMAQERNDYFSEKTQKRTVGLTAHLKKEAAGNKVPLHGSITISSLKGEQVID